MYIAGTKPNATGPYDGVAYEIYVSGCTVHCLNCHNPSMQLFDYGKPWDEAKEEIFADLRDMREWYDCVAILGGDLLSQDRHEAKAFADEVFHHAVKPMWLFTGYTADKIPKWVWRRFDVIKYGPYLHHLRQEGFPASSNQVVWRRTDDWYTVKKGRRTRENSYIRT